MTRGIPPLVNKMGHAETTVQQSGTLCVTQYITTKSKNPLKPRKKEKRNVGTQIAYITIDNNLTNLLILSLSQILKKGTKAYDRKSSQTSGRTVKT